MRVLIWLDITDVELLHSGIIAQSGGAGGLRDFGLLESALARPKNAYAYAYGEEDVFEFAALYAEGIARNHAFIDGNKRSAFMCAVIFLKQNGFRLRVQKIQSTPI